MVGSVKGCATIVGLRAVDEALRWKGGVVGRSVDELLGLVGTSPVQDSDDFLAQATQGLRLDLDPSGEPIRASPTLPEEAWWAEWLAR